MHDWAFIALGVYSVMSAATLGAYAADKRAASRPGARRTPERSLHTLEALGGWPGGLVARRALRHKSAKRRFRAVSWAIIVAHVSAWALVWRLAQG